MKSYTQCQPANYPKASAKSVNKNLDATMSADIPFFPEKHARVNKILREVTLAGLLPPIRVKKRKGEELKKS